MPSSAAAAIASDDPTGSATLRGEYVSHLNRRWTRVFGDVRRELQNNDTLKPRGPAETADSIGEFDHFLGDVLDEQVLEPLRPSLVTSGRHYSASYVRRAYKHGLKIADTLLHRIGVDTGDLVENYDRAIRADPHGEVLHRYYRKAYDKVEKAVNLSHEDAAERYADLLDGEAPIGDTISDPRTNHDGVNDRLRKMGQSATKLSALGIVVETINRAAIERYAEVDIESVSAIVEDNSDGDRANTARVHVTQPAPGDDGFQIFQTAGDRDVCDECSALAGSVYRIQEIRRGSAPMPVRDTHFGCRCFFVPYSPGGDWNVAELLGA